MCGYAVYGCILYGGWPADITNTAYDDVTYVYDDVTYVYGGWPADIATLKQKG